MEKGNEIIGIVLEFDNSMGTVNLHAAGAAKKSGHHYGAFTGIGIYNLVNGVYTSIKEDMATFKAGWILFHLLGIPATVLTVILSFMDGLPFYQKLITWVLASIYMIVNIYRGYEKARSDRIDNNIKEFDYHVKKGHYKHSAPKDEIA